MRLHAPSSDIEKMEAVQIHPHAFSRDEQKKMYQSFKPETNDSTGEEDEDENQLSKIDPNARFVKLCTLDLEYANYKNMSREEFELKYQALKIYCQQDTWAMVEILNELRKKVK